MNTKPHVLFGKARFAVLGLLFSAPNESFYLREIVRKCRLSPRSVQRELLLLQKGGLIRSNRIGRQSFFQADSASPIFPEVRNIVAKVYGPPRLITERLEAFRDRISFALIFGSFARGSHDARSDIDVLVVGHVSMREVGDVLYDLQKQISREINPSVYSEKSFRTKIASGDVFLTEVLKGQRILLIGDEHELTKLA